jgi:hypothetical protein
MNPSAWAAENFPDTIPVDRLERPRARKVATLLSSGGYNGAILTGCCRDPQSGDEILIVDVDVGLGQRPTINDVRSREPVALRFGQDNTLPSAFSLRDDFPTAVPHLNVVPSGHPRTFCLYNALPNEVLITYTALRFIERVRWWLRETAYSRLHGDDQPLDPLFHPVGVVFVLPADFLTRPQSAYVATRVSPRPWSPFLLDPVTATSLGRITADQTETFAAISLVTKPILHGRMRNLPTDLQELLSTYETAGADIRPLLVDAFAALVGLQGHNALLQRPLLLLLSSPLMRNGASGAAESVATKAFIAPSDSSGSVAVVLGALYNAHGQWGRPLGQVSPGDLRTIKILPADVQKDLVVLSRAMRRGRAPRAMTRRLH